MCAIAKLYTKLGEENNKKENYKRANLYFKEMLDIATIDSECIEQLRALMEKTEDKNVNLYQVAEQTLNMFQEL